MNFGWSTKCKIVFLQKQCAKRLRFIQHSQHAVSENTICIDASEIAQFWAFNTLFEHMIGHVALAAKGRAKATIGIIHLDTPKM
jgi:hypothetical protein